MDFTDICNVHITYINITKIINLWSNPRCVLNFHIASSIMCVWRGFAGGFFAFIFFPFGF